MRKDYKVTIDDDETPDWLVLLKIALFLFALPIGLLYLIIKGIVKLCQNIKEKRELEEYEARMAPIRAKQEKIDSIKTSLKKCEDEIQKILTELNQLASLLQSGIISKNDMESRRKYLVDNLSKKYTERDNYERELKGIE